MNPPSTKPPVFHFTRDLQLAMRGEDVRALQQYLNAHGFELAIYGSGSPGHETDLFGYATQYQLAQFQRVNGIDPAAGFFGQKTREVVNVLRSPR